MVIINSFIERRTSKFKDKKIKNLKDMDDNIFKFFIGQKFVCPNSDQIVTITNKFYRYIHDGYFEDLEIKM